MQEKKIVVLPVLIVYDDKNLGDGIYFCDVFNEYVIKYKELELSKKYVKKGITWLFYLNIDEAIVCFKKSAYTKGAVQVGMIKQEITNVLLRNNYYEKEIVINRPSITHSIGINVRKELLIDYSLWGIKE